MAFLCEQKHFAYHLITSIVIRITLASYTHTMSQPHPTQNSVPMFITTNTLHREAIFSDDACARTAVENLYKIQSAFPFFLFAFVIMPDHCHFLLTVPDGGSISKIMQAYKRAVSFDVGKPIWQRRFHQEFIRDISKVKRYVHENPVQKNLCTEANLYPWSSASGRWDIADVP